MSIPSGSLYASAGTQYGAAIRPGVKLKVEKAIQIKGTNISTQRAKELALKAFGPIEGPKVVARMLHRVMKPIRIGKHKWGVTPTQATSNIWGGYVVNNKDSGSYPITGAVGSYNVSQVGSAAPDTATWTGVGGYNGTNLIQTAVSQQSLQAWYELYPNELPVYVFSVKNGDQVKSSVDFDPTDNMWYVFVQNTNTGIYYAHEYSFNPDQTTADWITEVHNTGPVPPFNPVNFTGAQWDDNNGNLQDLNDPTCVGVLD